MVSKSDFFCIVVGWYAYVMFMCKRFGCCSCMGKYVFVLVVLSIVTIFGSVLVQ